MKPAENITRFLHRYRESAIDILILFVLVETGSIVYALLNPDSFHYLSDANISVMLKSIPVLGVLSLGVGILMITGEFDLSVGASYTLTGIFMAKQVESGTSVFIAALMAIGLGILIGLLNGFITLRFAIPSFIATLGTMLFWEGMTLYYHGARSIRFRPDETFTELMAGNIGLMQASFLWFIGLGVVFWALLHHHKLGNHFFAVGGNRRAATAIGINPIRVKLIAFGLVGLCAALAGILAASRVGAIQPGQGRGLELRAIAACVIGGVALTGGRGAILGVVLGSALIYTIQDILLLARAPGFYLDIFVGVLIVGAAIFNQMIRDSKTMSEPTTTNQSSSAVPLLELRGVCKRYGAVMALCDLDFQINQREIVGLLGDNGAGKSTLIKLMSGVIQADEGKIFADGKEVTLNSRRDSEALGIETIYQDTALVDTMSVTRNVFMGREITNFLGFMRHRKMRDITLEVLERAVHIGGIDDPHKLVGELSGGQKQAVAIARAVYFKRLILLLDEPTSALAVRATERLLAYIRELKEEGVSSVLVTHNLYHAYQVCDRFVVMSHGAKVLDVPKENTSLEALTEAVIMM